MSQGTITSKQSFRQRHYSDRSFHSTTTGSLAPSESTVGSDIQIDEDEKVEYFEKGHGWKTILYLPFDAVWQQFIVGCMILNLFLSTKRCIQGRIREGGTVFETISDIFVTTDNILMLLAKMFKLSISYDNVNRPIWLILSNILTSLPDVIAEAPFNTKDSKIIYFIQLRDLLKILHITYYTYYNLQMIRRQRTAIAMYNYFVIVFCVYIVINYLYFLQDCVLSDEECDSVDNYGHMITAGTTIVFKNFAVVPVPAHLLITQCICSYFAYFCVFVPLLLEIIEAIVNKRRNEYAYQKEKQLAEIALSETNTPSSIKTKILQIFELHWEKHCGYRDSDLKLFLKTLAPSIAEEIITDMNFLALKHSKLFQNMDVPFLRCVALKMEQTFAVPGQLLYKKNTNKHEMIYVVSGIIQVLSQDNGDSTILSLSSGTCLGETTIFLNYNSITSIVCKEYCVLQVLSMEKIVEIGRKFPKQVQRLKRVVINRYETAKKLKTFGSSLRISQGTVKNENKLRIMWLNTTLHRLMMKDVHTFSKHVFRNIYLREDIDSSAYQTTTSTATYLDLLAIAERAELVSDSIFYKTDTFPPIFRPNSTILNIWDILVCTVAVYLCFTIPLHAFMVLHTPSWYWWLSDFATLLYIIDVYLLVTTVPTVQDADNVKDFKGIFVYQINTLDFWFDFLAAYPLQLQANSFALRATDLNYGICYLNRCFKFVKVMKIFNRYIKWYREKCKEFVEYLEFNIILFYFSCFLTPLFKMGICRMQTIEVCFTGTLISRFLAAFQNVINFLYLYGTVVDNEMLIKNLYDIYLICCIVANTCLLLVVANVTSKKIMSSYSQIQLTQTTINFKEVSDCLAITKSCKKRIFNYIATEWSVNHAQRLFSSNDIFAEIPPSTYKFYKENSFRKYLCKMPLFSELSDEEIAELCTFAYVDVLPPKEIISYKGELTSVIYYLIDGMVELSCGPNSTHTIQPGDSLSVFEAYLHLPVLNTSTTLTYCRLLILPWNMVKTVITPIDDIKYSDLKEQFYQMKEKCSSNSPYNLDLDDEKSASLKYFGYHLKLDSFEEYDYFVPFDRLQAFSFIRFLLLRITFLPNGRIMLFWELFRSMIAIASAIVFTIPPLLIYDNFYWKWTMIYLDLIGYIDMYIKLHYCYYNDKAILVTHPLKTATHYLTHSFLIDVITTFPFRFMFFNETAYKNKISAFVHTIKYMQLYRIYFLSKGTALIPNLILSLLRYCLLLLVAILLTSCIMVNLYCKFHDDIPASAAFQKGITCSKDSIFVLQIFNLMYKLPFSIIDLYTYSIIVVALYFTKMNFLLFIVGADVFVQIIQYIFMICGYCFYIFLISKFSIWLSDETDILEYKWELRLLKRFMKSQKVKQNIQRELIQHYEMKWEKNRNNGLYVITKNFHKTLQADIIHDVYGDVLEKTTIFHDVDCQFYKRLLIDCRHEVVRSDFTICSVNDIMPLIYILYDGCVKVIAPDGTILTTLGVGSMFGNLDDYPRVRQTVGFIADGNVELLVITTINYFKSLKKYPNLHKQFIHLTSMHIDYLKSPCKKEVIKEKETVVEEVFFITINKEKAYYKMWRFLQLFVICYLVNCIHLYMLAINENNIYFYIIFYISDVAYLIDVLYIRNHSAFTSGGLLGKRITFIVSIISTIPLDIVFWFLPISDYWRYRGLLILRLNRQLRVYDIFDFLYSKRFTVTSSQMLLEYLGLICFITITLFVLSCCYIKGSCFKYNLPAHGRRFDCEIINDPKGDWFIKLRNFSVSVYVAAELLLGVAQLYQIPNHLGVLLCFSMVAILATILSAFLCAEICCTWRSDLYWRSAYESHCSHLFHFMKRRLVSEPLLRKVWNHLRFFWKRQNGVNFPNLIIEAPDPLKLKIFGTCYMHHIKKNVVFKKCHEDFVKQLLLTMKMYTYFTGDYITFKGDINGCMYFIHKGSVLIMSEDSCTKEDVIGKLIVGQFFGMIQGLYPTMPHGYYYQAASNCDILCLNSKSWMYLLDYFPASREVIYSAAENYMGL